MPGHLGKSRAGGGREASRRLAVVRVATFGGELGVAVPWPVRRTRWAGGVMSFLVRWCAPGAEDLAAPRSRYVSERRVGIG